MHAGCRVPKLGRGALCAAGWATKARPRGEAHRAWARVVPMTNPYVLVHIVTKLELGGAQLATLHQVTHSAFGARGRHLVFGPGGMLDAEAHKIPGVTAWPIAALTGPLHAARDAAAIFAIVKCLRRIRLRHAGCKLLVHTHSSKAGILGRGAALVAGAECLVHTIHGFGHQPSMPKALFYALWAAEKVAAPITSGFTADSQANLDRGWAEGLLGQKPAAVVRCGIDLTAFSPGAPPSGLRRALGLTPQSPIVLTVACLKPQKDPLTWVEVAARVVAVRPNAVFLLAGDGVLKPAVVQAIEARGLAAHCRLLGWRHDVLDLMRLSDLVLHTSLWEGLPQVFAQAMACAKPIVATCVDGAPEAIQAGVTGLLRPPKDAAGLAADVRTLLDDPKAAKAMGQAAQPRANAFSQAHMCADLDRFYRKLTGLAPS